jgi:OOP family OmpA-OmpF porin
MEEPTMPTHDLQWPGQKVAALVAVALLASCATHNASLEQARASYDRARQDANIARYAPVALSEAGETLSRAEQASGRDEVTHLAYLAQRKVEIAEATAQGKMAENQAQGLLSRRDKLLLEQRNREVQELQGQLTDLRSKMTERGLMITLGDVLFETGRAGLKPGAQQRLLGLVRFLLDHPDRKVVIEGHTDNRGSEPYNMGLSQRRAESVRAFLIRSGVSPERISAEGLGEAYPVASNGTPAGRLQNRRVEIYLPTPGQETAGHGRTVPAGGSGTSR